MSTRRGFLRLLGVGAGAAVAAPVASKALDVLTQPGTDMYLNNHKYNPSTDVGPFEGQRVSGQPVDWQGNPHVVTKTEVGLGRVSPEWELQDLVGSQDLVRVIDGVSKRIR